MIYPVVGGDSFRPATGVHAAAIAKAISRNDGWLADRVYCGVPATMVGRTQGIEVGPMSGEHNVRFWLRNHEMEENPVYVDKILAAAKRSNKLLSDDDIRRMVVVMHQRLQQGEAVRDEELELLLVGQLQEQRR